MGDDNVLEDIKVTPYDLVLKNITTLETVRLFNVTFVGLDWQRSMLRPGIDLALQNPKISKIHARIEVCDWESDDEKPHGNRCPYKVVVYDEVSYNGTYVDAVDCSEYEAGMVIGLGTQLRFGSDEVWTLEKMRKPAQRRPPPARESDGWPVFTVEQKDIWYDAGGFRAVKDWYDLSSILVSRSIIGVQEVEVTDMLDTPIEGLKFCAKPADLKSAHKKAIEISKKVKYGWKIRYMTSTHNKLVEGVAKNWTDVEEVHHRALECMPNVNVPW